MHTPHPEFHAATARVSPWRSLIKTLGYRVISVTSTVAIAGFIFGDWTIAAGFGAVDMVANTVLYYGHERLWAHIDLNLDRKARRDGKA